MSNMPYYLIMDDSYGCISQDCRESVRGMKTSPGALSRRRNTIYQDHLPFITDTPGGLLFTTLYLLFNYSFTLYQDHLPFITDTPAAGELFII